MKVVKTCENAFEAGLIQGRLLNEGIEAEVLHDSIEQVLPYSYAMPDLKPQVAVSDADYRRAMELLQEPLPQEKRQCPYCGSEDIVFGLHDRNWKRRLLVVGVFFLSLLTLGPLGKIQCTYFCRHCRQRFS